jgi:ferredoxin-type protein NapG
MESKIYFGNGLDSNTKFFSGSFIDMQQPGNPDRRAFFKLGLRKAAKTAVKGADIVAKQRAQHWIRPPYALEELEFLMACTRCGACIEACPHEIIFALSARLGAQVVNTPAMNLLYKGCHLCNDWPCVQVCEPAALTLPEKNDDTSQENPPTLPRIAIAFIDTQTCLPYSGPECGVCANSCPVPNALCWNGTQPHIDPDICTGCARCREACIVEPKAVHIQSLHKKSKASL